MDPDSSVVPQEYVVTLRPGDPLSLPINVTTFEQSPLDLYILFDLSMSTSDEVEAIRTVARTICKWVEGKGGWRERREGKEEESSLKCVILTFKHTPLQLVIYGILLIKLKLELEDSLTSL